MTGGSSWSETATVPWVRFAGASHELMDLPYGPLDHYAEILVRLLRTLDSNDSVTRELLTALRRIRFEAHVLPVPTGHDLLWGRAEVSDYLAEAEALAAEDAERSALWTEMAHSIQDLRSDVGPSILWQEVERLWPSVAKPAAFVTRRQRQVGPVEDLASGLAGRPKVLSQSDAAHRWDRKTFIVLGPPAAYAPWLMNFPRSDRTIWIKYASASQRLPAERVFKFTSKGPRKLAARKVKSTKLVGGLPHQEFSEADQDLLTVPEVDWNEYVSRKRESLSLTSEDAEDVVPARAIILDGDLPVLMSDEPGARTTVLDVDGADVRQEPVARLKPGMYAVLRTEGGGDFVPEVANHLLGANAEYLRGQAGDWKKELRDALDRLGAPNLGNRLSKMGVDANLQTIRSWATEHNIAPGKLSWFRALMEAIGRSDADEQWRVVETLRRAHRMAGHRVREMLLAQIKRVDAAELRGSGRIDFTLAGEQGGRLTAFRIEACPGAVFYVPRSMLNHIDEGDGLAWHG